MNTRSPSATFRTTDKNLSDWIQTDFWKSICKHLSVDNVDLIPRKSAFDDKKHGEKVRRLIRERGYFLVDETIEKPSIIEALREGIETLERHNFPASFILLYDETWELAAASRDMLAKSTLETNKFNFDILAWHIKSGGFSPHRDRQPDDVDSSFSKDGDPKFVTNWIALTEATPQNSCLYVIPKYCDPGYTAGDANNEDPLRRALPNKEAFQEIRALSRHAGQSIMFSHRIIHWGSRREQTTHLPARIAISFVCSDPDFEKPYIRPAHFSDESAPPFHIRLLLVCAQLLIYYQRFDLSKEVIKSCYVYCKQYELELDESYRRKVFVEFVKAMKEVTAAETDAPSVKDGVEKKRQQCSGVNNKVPNNGSLKTSPKHTEQDGNQECDDDDEDAMMEEILNAEEGGYGEFADDYDELGDETGGDFDDGNVSGGGDTDNNDDDDEEGILFGKRKSGAAEDDEVVQKRKKSS